MIYCLKCWYYYVAVLLQVVILSRKLYTKLEITLIIYLYIRQGLCGKLTDLDYADDICLLAHSTRAMLTMLGRTETAAAKVGLKIDVNQSKEIRIAMNNRETLCIRTETI